MKYKSVFLTFVFAVSMCVFVIQQLSAESSSILTIALLSDHEATIYGGIPIIESKPTENAVHIAWTESVTDYYETDVFYRKMPEGMTVNLSDFVTDSGSAGPIFIQSSTTEDHVCVLWREETATGDYHLFLWRSETGSVNISPNPVGDGFNDDMEFTAFECSASENAKIAWVDTTEEVFLWDETSDTQVKLSNEEDGSISNFRRVATANNVYLAWEKGYSGGHPMFLWDASSNSVQQMATNGHIHELIKDYNDTVYLFWGQSVPMGPGCSYYWDNVTEVADVLECDTMLNALNDGNGGVHAFWYRDYSVSQINHWNVTTNITQTVGDPNKSIKDVNLFEGPDDRIHLFWQDGVTDELYYWNSGMLSETLVTSASYYIQDNMKLDFDSTGQIHAAWNDAIPHDNATNVYYWTPSLSTPITITDQSLYTPIFDIAVDSQDVAHVVYTGQTGQPGMTLLQHWDSQMEQSEVVTSQAVWVFSEIEAVASDDEIFVFFMSTNNDQYYWNSESGEFLLGKNESGDAHFATPIFSDAGDIFAYWVSDADDLNKGKDVFGAWLFEANHQVYLPVVMK